MYDLMKLQGPSQAVLESAQRLLTGAVVMTRPDRYEASMSAGLTLAIKARGMEVITLGASEGFDFAKKALQVDPTTLMSPDRLMGISRLRNTVVRVNASAGIWRDWALALHRRMTARLADSTIKLWLHWDDQAVAPPVSKFVRELTWRDQLTPADVRIFAATQFIRSRGPGPTFYWEELATELAGPDLPLIERMAATAEQLIDPLTWLTADAGTPHPTVNFDDREFVSPLTLARNMNMVAKNELDQRIWSAQVRQIFPAIER